MKCFSHPLIATNINRFECDAYSNIHKANRKSKPYENTERGVFSNIEQGLYRLHLFQITRIVMSKYVTINYNVSTMAKPNKEMVYIVEDGTSDFNKTDVIDTEVPKRQPHVATEKPTLSDQNQKE